MGTIYYDHQTGSTKCRHLTDHNFGHDKSNWNRPQRRLKSYAKIKQNQNKKQLGWREGEAIQVLEAAQQLALNELVGRCLSNQRYRAWKVNAQAPENRIRFPIDAAALGAFFARMSCGGC